MLVTRRSPQGARRRTGLIVALAATVALTAGLLAFYLARPDPPQLTSPPAAGVLTTTDVGPTPAIAPSGTVSPAGSPITVRFTFDGGVNQPIADTSGRFMLHALGQNGGTLSLVPQGEGLALQYPTRCTLTPERQCPRAILEGTHDNALNPGTRPIRYGASIKMTHRDLADGANVLQKGFSVGGISQFKLQVDHQQGHPSCVVAGRTKIYRAEPPLDVADGKWHTLTCSRSPNRLAIKVDGVQRATVAVPAELSIANAEPLRIGGKSPNNGNDQFAGLIDDVFLTIG